MLSNLLSFDILHLRAHYPLLRAAAHSAAAACRCSTYCAARVAGAAVLQVVSDCVKAVCRALLLADVQLRVVQEFRRNVTQQINAQIQQHSSSSSSAGGSSKKKGAAAGGTKAFDAASGTAGPAGPQNDVMAEVYIQAAAAGVNTRRIIQKVQLATASYS